MLTNKTILRIAGVTLVASITAFTFGHSTARTEYEKNIPYQSNKRPIAVFDEQILQEREGAPRLVALATDKQFEDLEIDQRYHTEAEVPRWENFFDKRLVSATPVTGEE
jgi:hypothetical protein